MRHWRPTEGEREFRSSDRCSHQPTRCSWPPRTSRSARGTPRKCRSSSASVHAGSATMAWSQTCSCRRRCSWKLLSRLITSSERGRRSSNGCGSKTVLDSTTRSTSPNALTCQTCPHAAGLAKRRCGKTEEEAAHLSAKSPGRPNYYDTCWDYIGCVRLSLALHPARVPPRGP